MSNYLTHSRHLGAPSDTRGVSARDAGLALAAQANRWMISGAVILAGGLTAVTAHAFHPRTAPQVRSMPTVQRAVPAQGAGEKNRGTPLQAPSQPPAAAAPTPTPAPVVSGGS